MIRVRCLTAAALLCLPTVGSAEVGGGAPFDSNLKVADTNDTFAGNSYAAGNPYAAENPNTVDTDAYVTASLPDGSSDETPRLGVFARVGSIWVQDPGFDLVSGVDAMPRVELGVGFAPAEFWTLELSYGLAGAASTVFEAVDSSLQLHQFQFAAVGRLPIAKRLRVLGRAGVGFELAHLSLDDGQTNRLSDTAPLLALEGSLGIEWTLPLSLSEKPDSSTSSFDLSMEMGYGYRPLAASFDDLDRAGDDDQNAARVAGVPVDVGDLDLSGWVLRFGAALRF